MTLFYTDAICLEHSNGPGHPEQPARLQAIERQLRKEELWDLIEHRKPRAATVDEIARCHDKDYIQQVEKFSKQAAGKKDGLVRLGWDTSVTKDSYQAALMAAGALLSACEAVHKGDAHNAFCAVRPPGHHARPAKEMGFCLFGNVAVAARHLQKTMGYEKIAILDWDVHHGNGTQEIFEEDPTVFFLSMHQHPHYPGTGMAEETGKGKGKGTTLNLPFPAGTPAAQLRTAWRKALENDVKKFKPDFILISAGFDSVKGDPLGGFTLEPKDFGGMTRTVMDVADDCCKDRIVSALEGGYNLEKLGQCVEHHIETLRHVKGQPDWVRDKKEKDKKDPEDK